MRKRVWTLPILHTHTAKFTCVADPRCKETLRLYMFTAGTPRNLHVMLLADAKQRLQFTISTPQNYVCCCSPMQRNVSTVPTLHRHTAKFSFVAAHRCKETSRLYQFTIGTPQNLHVLLLTDAKKFRDCADSP